MAQSVKWWTPCFLLMVIILLQAICFVAIIIVWGGLHPETIPGGAHSGYLALYSVVKNTVVLVVLLVAVRKIGARPGLTLRLQRVSFREMVASCFMMLALMPLDVYFAQQFGSQRVTTGPDPTHLNLALVVWWISLIFLTPVAEELFFRGLAITALGSKSILAGVLGSCVLFGVYHFSGSIASLVIPLPFAVATAYAVVMTGSVYPAIAAHMLWNLLAVVGNVGYGLFEPTWGMFLTSVIVFATCAALLMWKNASREQAPTTPSPTTSAADD